LARQRLLPGFCVSAGPALPLTPALERQPCNEQAPNRFDNEPPRHRGAASIFTMTPRKSWCLTSLLVAFLFGCGGASNSKDDDTSDSNAAGGRRTNAWSDQAGGVTFGGASVSALGGKPTPASSGVSALDSSSSHAGGGARQTTIALGGTAGVVLPNSSGGNHRGNTLAPNTATVASSLAGMAGNYGSVNAGGRPGASTGTSGTTTIDASATGGNAPSNGGSHVGGSSMMTTSGAGGNNAAGGVPNGGTRAVGGTMNGSTSEAGSDGGNAIVAPLPKRVLVGWGAASADDKWAKNSGTKYDVQWTYLSGQAGNNWYNTWGYGAADGAWLDGMLNTIDSYGFIPGIHLYNMGYGHDRGDAGLLTEIQDASWSKQYFTEFKVMLQKIKKFGKPVIVVLEGDSFGMIEMLTSNQPNTPAAVASTGLPELAALPNTVAGFGLAYLALRKSLGVSNIAMGPDTPYYAANGDIMNFPPSDTEPLAAHVAYQWSFFGPLGVGTNQTGDRFDFSASCPRAADQGAYNDGRDPWSINDTASVNTPSINRYVEWLRLYNRTSGVPWVLHQVPIGNSQHSNTPYSANTARSGYRDILVEYLFQYESPASPSIRSAHVGDFARAGVAAFLFGFSDDGDQPTNDWWTDNQPFFNAHVNAFIQAGGYPL
jgi:hypothetical protein